MAGLFPIGKPQLASDVTTAGVVNQPGSQTQRAIDGRVETIVVDVVGNDDVVKEAAATAVTADIAGRDLIEGTDSRVPQAVLDEGIKYSLVDELDRRSWIEIGADGGPTQHSVAMMNAAGVGVGGLPDGAITLPKLAAEVLDRLPESGSFTDAMIPAARRLYSRGADGTVRPLASDPDAVAFFGDSLFDGWPRPPFLVDRSNSLPGVFATQNPGITVYNGGRTGQTADEIAIRQGGLVLRVTVVGGSIPASGGVEVTGVGIYGWQTDRTWDCVGVLNGIPGTISRVASTLTFTRTTAGSATATAGVVDFLSTPGLTYRNNVQIIMPGRNDIGWTSPAGDVVDRVVTAGIAMMESFPSLHRRALLFGPTTSTAEVAGTTGHTQAVEIGDAFRRLYPEQYFDFRSWLVYECIYELGITPTTGDLSNMANDTVPPSIMTDAIHYSPATAGRGAAKAKSLLLARGWIA